MGEVDLLKLIISWNEALGKQVKNQGCQIAPKNTFPSWCCKKKIQLKDKAHQMSRGWLYSYFNLIPWKSHWNTLCKIKFQLASEDKALLWRTYRKTRIWTHTQWNKRKPGYLNHAEHPWKIKTKAHLSQLIAQSTEKKHIWFKCVHSHPQRSNFS